MGFRPFVYALAADLGLTGFVGNTADGVVAEVEGRTTALDEFGRRLVDAAPAAARVMAVRVDDVPSVGGTGFRIVSSSGGAGRTLVSPDLGICDDCLAELVDPANRRYRHPFISCTNCGPRFTVIEDLPYDRPTTTMAPLPLCARCSAEYADPSDRRFHCQTIACWDCGPALSLRTPEAVSHAGTAVAETRRLLGAGKIIAVKGIGGYHLACDASNSPAVARIRARKRRGDKPFAVMVADVAAAELIADVRPAERDLLRDPARPVVLMAGRARPGLALAPEVAPGHPDIGVVLAYSPMHRLLFGLPGDPPGPRALVMTSANVSGEPLITDDDEALARLAGLADAWLLHDRRITVPCDDSVVRLVAGSALPVRRSRGYAPMPVELPAAPSGLPTVLAVGGDLKNVCCLSTGDRAWMSGHIGDMDDVATLRAFGRAVDHLARLTELRPSVLACDTHPQYRSADWARRHADGRPIVAVQHHHAHIASVMAENAHDGAAQVIGFAFDGTGFGDDGAIWGGEALLCDYDTSVRAGHLGYVPLPGGDAAVKNPYRMALSHLHDAGIEWSATLPCVRTSSAEERAILAHQFRTGLSCVPTSSMGRLFDAMSSLAGVCHRADYEAEAAMRFEGLARAGEAGLGRAYAFGLPEGPGPLVADCGPVLRDGARDVAAGVAPAVIAARFHHAVADLVVAWALRLRNRTGVETVALSGGVFLNALLTRLCLERLESHAFRVLRHRLLPPSDAGLALGQAMIAGRAAARGAP